MTEPRNSERLGIYLTISDELYQECPKLGNDLQRYLVTVLRFHLPPARVSKKPLVVERNYNPTLKSYEFYFDLWRSREVLKEDVAKMRRRCS